MASFRVATGAQASASHGAPLRASPRLAGGLPRLDVPRNGLVGLCGVGCRDARVPTARLASGGRAPRPTAAMASGGRTPRPAASVAAARAPPPPAITISNEALVQLRRMRADRGSPEAVLRMGVKTGGCSGMSYTMDFISPNDVSSEDSVMEAGEGLRLVCDAKALLYLFGLRLEFSDALIGGGFKFDNPNAKAGCGCGKSFKV